MILSYEAFIRPQNALGVQTFAEHTDFWCSVIATTEQEANDAIAAFKALRGDRRAILRRQQHATREVDFMTDRVSWRASVRFVRFDNWTGDMEPVRQITEPLLHGFSKEEPAP